VNTVKNVFVNFARVELKYRNLGDDITVVFDDIVQNCLSISLREKIGNADFDVLQLGLKQITSYIFSENYQIEKAITHAARTAYIVALMQSGKPILRFSNKIDMNSWVIEQPHNTKLNKLKKTNQEAFFYWFQYFKLLSAN